MTEPESKEPPTEGHAEPPAPTEAGVAEFVPIEEEEPAAEIDAPRGAETAVAEAASNASPTASVADVAPSASTDWRLLAAGAWAAIATILAGGLWWSQPPYPSPLENLPDDGELKPK